MIYYCKEPECNNEISCNSANHCQGICHSCEMKRRHKLGIMNSKGIKNGFYGKKHTKETKKKLRGKRPSMTGKNNRMWKEENHKTFYCIDCKSKICGVTWLYGQKRCLKCKSKGKNNSNYKDGRVSKKYYCQECGGKVSLTSALYGDSKCIACEMKRRYKEDIFLKNSPNNTEVKLDKFLQRLLPNEYKFVGNGKVIFDRLCPDFINVNGQKKIIELYGDYWHNLLKNKQRDMNRIKTYTKYGYETLIVWEKELKDLIELKEKILTFNQ